MDDISQRCFLTIYAIFWTEKQLTNVPPSYASFLSFLNILVACRSWWSASSTSGSSSGATTSWSAPPWRAWSLGRPAWCSPPSWSRSVKLLGRPISELPIWFIEIYISGRGSSRHCEANIVYCSSLAKGIAIPETTIKFGWFCFGQLSVDITSEWVAFCPCFPFHPVVFRVSFTQSRIKFGGDVWLQQLCTERIIKLYTRRVRSNKS